MTSIQSNSVRTAPAAQRAITVSLVVGALTTLTGAAIGARAGGGLGAIIGGLTGAGVGAALIAGPRMTSQSALGAGFLLSSGSR